MKTHCTRRDFERFQVYCDKLLKKFRLNNWVVNYRMQEGKTDKLAECTYLLTDFTATITLFSDWSPLPVTSDGIMEIAFHEVLHILMADLTESAAEGASEEMVRHFEHEIIKRFCLFFSKPRKK